MGILFPPAILWLDFKSKENVKSLVHNGQVDSEEKIKM
jgi:hypothetical protein